MITDIIQNLIQYGGSQMRTIQTLQPVERRNKSSIYYFLGFIISQSIVILVFTFIYRNVLGSDQFNTIDPNPSFIDFLYFTMSTHTRIGYGDIIPKTPMAKKVVMLQQFVVILEIVGQLTFLTSAMLNPAAAVVTDTRRVTKQVPTASVGGPVKSNMTNNGRRANMQQQPMYRQQSAPLSMPQFLGK